MSLFGTLKPCLGCLLNVECALQFCSIQHVTLYSSELVSEAEY